MLCAYILTVEVLYTETSATTFMIFRILWKNSTDFHVFIVLFIIPILEIISNLLLADRS